MRQICDLTDDELSSVKRGSLIKEIRRLRDLAKQRQGGRNFYREERNKVEAMNRRLREENRELRKKLQEVRGECKPG